MTDKVLRFSGFRPIKSEVSEFYTGNLLYVFRQLDQIQQRPHAKTVQDLWPDEQTEKSPDGDSGNGPAA